jgi:hypothetical protein
MVKIVVIEKGGEVVETKMKDFSLETLYKKCKFRKPDGFTFRHMWEVNLNKEQHLIALYARDFGKAGMENKYDLPPPVDTTLYFGTMALVRLSSKDILDINVRDLDVVTWNKIYEKLFGGFHNLADTALEDEEEEDELADLPAHMKTKHGYLKDGFIVDDNNSSVDHSPAESPEGDTTDLTDVNYESELDFEDYEYMEETEEDEDDDEDDDDDDVEE